MGARGCSAFTSTLGPGARARRTPRGRWTQPCPCSRSMRTLGSCGRRWSTAPGGGGRCSGSRWTDDRTEEAGRALLCGAESLKYALMVVLAPGPHVLRAVLCRPWHEVVKAPKAFAMVRLWIGPRLSGKAGRAAEAAVWPNPRKPILTYVLPIGAPSKGLVLARIEQDAAQAKEPDLPPPAGANRAVVDFY